MDILNLVSLAFGVVGILASIFYGQKAELLRKHVKSVDWKEIESAANYLARQIKRSAAPAAFVATDSRGGIIAKLVAEKIDLAIPIFVGASYEQADNPPLQIKGFRAIETDKWKYFLPEAAFHQVGRLILVDDVVFSGETVKAVKRGLEAAGVKQLKTIAILSSEIAHRQGIGPDWYWRTTPYSEIYFPWGRMR